MEAQNRTRRPALKLPANRRIIAQNLTTHQSAITRHITRHYPLPAITRYLPANPLLGDRTIILLYKTLQLLLENKIHSIR